MKKLFLFFFFSLLVFSLFIFWPNLGVFLEFKLASYTGNIYSFALENGEFVYGKIESSGFKWIKLSDVYYFQSIEVNGNTTKNLVSQRSNVLTSPPNFMILNVDRIVSVERLGSSSKLLDLMKPQ
jgi:hypothetical protein